MFGQSCRDCNLVMVEIHQSTESTIAFDNNADSVGFCRQYEESLVREESVG